MTTTTTALQVQSLLCDREGATIRRHPTKAAAMSAMRPLKLGPEVRPERAVGRFFRFWVIAAEPVGAGRTEGRVLLTEQGGWVVHCAADCIEKQWNPARERQCAGHPMTADDSRDFTVVLVGHHRTEVISIGTERKVRLTDGSYMWNPAGTLYRGRCMDCPWKSIRLDERRWAFRATKDHERDPGGKALTN